MSSAKSTRVLGHVGLDSRERFLGEVHEVDLVDGDDHVGDAQQRRDGEVAAGLLDHAVARIDEHHQGVGRGGAGHRIARVLHVPGQSARMKVRRGVEK